VPGYAPTKNAPSRWRLRPASRLTAAEATADRRAINLGRSVLGASGTLWTRSFPVKNRTAEFGAICDNSDREVSRMTNADSLDPPRSGACRSHRGRAQPRSCRTELEVAFVLEAARAAGRQQLNGRDEPPERAQRNAPSRLRLRPASPLTAAEAIACRGAINLGRSVLGASRTLGGRATSVKVVSSELFANCEVFFSHSV
jgi:hypothetical protein